MNSFESGALSQAEKGCVVACLMKYRDATRYLAEKTHKIMMEQAMQSQEIAALYDTNLDKEAA